MKTLSERCIHGGKFPCAQCKSNRRWNEKATGKSLKEEEFHAIYAAPPPKPEPASPEDEALIDKCLEIMRQERKASTSLFQRRLRLGYTHAERLLSIMEKRGHVGPGKGTTPREILIALPELSKTEPASPPPTWRVVRGGNFVDVVTVGYPAKKICAVTDYASAELIAAAPETARQRDELADELSAVRKQRHLEQVAASLQKAKLVAAEEQRDELLAACKMVAERAPALPAFRFGGEVAVMLSLADMEQILDAMKPASKNRIIAPALLKSVLPKGKK